MPWVQSIPLSRHIMIPAFPECNPTLNRLDRSVRRSGTQIRRAGEWESIRGTLLLSLFHTSAHLCAPLSAEHSRYRSPRTGNTMCERCGRSRYRHRRLLEQTRSTSSKLTVCLVVLGDSCGPIHLKKRPFLRHITEAVQKPSMKVLL